MKKRHGLSLIELLMASLVAVLGVVGMFSSWGYCNRIIVGQRTTNMAYQLARADIERAKVLGFANLPLGTLDVAKTTAVYTAPTEYFDASGAKLANSTGAYYSVVRTVTDKQFLAAGSTYSLLSTSIRTVKTKVSKVQGNAEVVTMATNVIQGGI
jgi:Tfp pilus assembly protein PilV